MQKRKVFVVGAGGMVGATAAQAIAVQELVSDVVLIDIAAEVAQGQAMDIAHATAFTSGVHVRAGDYAEIGRDDIVIITCGIAQQPGQSRLELLETNARIIRDVVGKVMAQGEPVYIMMVTNPVDVLTMVALEASGLPRHRVFGSGTTLDTARLRVRLAHDLHVATPEVEAYILGEHGDSSFAALSHVTIGGIPLAQFPGYEPTLTATIEEDIRRSAYQIIAAKKSTYYGIGQVVANIVTALLRDRATILPVSSMTTGEYGLQDVAVGLPHMVSSQGVTILDGYPLNPTEQTKLEVSAQTVKEAYDSLQLAVVAS